ncbi:hypothetical protein J3458_021117 [Metarhizium acridum]|uniref:uncharacterized protein n=1 Tax=Metarhizium acridum TaxID=92637 RepID=UPI001C6ABBF9|nr:hypothetical protein J3458_021117 [Metarhizium acridum]
MALIVSLWLNIDSTALHGHSPGAFVADFFCSSWHPDILSLNSLLFLVPFPFPFPNVEFLVPSPPTSLWASTHRRQSLPSAAPAIPLLLRVSSLAADSFESAPSRPSCAARILTSTRSRALPHQPILRSSSTPDIAN